MRLFRIAKSEYVRDLTGTGARLYGGRWNQKGTALVYTSESRALATVEFLVHFSLPQAPAGLALATLEIPAAAQTEQVALQPLPEHWRGFPPPAELAALGTRWAREGKSLLLRVPSAVVEGESNLLINPAHLEAAGVRIARVAAWDLDARLMER